MAVTASGQVEYNSLLMPSSVYEIQSIEGIADYPDLRASDATLLSRHGMHAGTDVLAGRKITLTVAIHAGDATTFGNAVAAFRAAFTPASAVSPVAPGFYQGDAPLTFRFPGIAASANAQILCRPRRLSMGMTSQWNNGWSTTAIVELFANDPVIYGTTQRSASFAINGGSTTANNAGNWPSLYLITIGSITGPLTNPNISNNNLAVLKHIQLLATYNSGDNVNILPDQRRILYDPTPVGAPYTDHYSKLSADSQWWALLPGNNSIVGSRSVGTATVTLNWYDSWV